MRAGTDVCLRRQIGLAQKTMSRFLVERPPSSITFDEYEIRQYVIDDARAIMESVTESREYLRPWMPWIQYEPLDVHDRRKLIREWRELWKKGEDFPMGIFRGKVLVGGTGFHLRGPEGTLDIGYWLHHDEIGKRIVSRTVRELLRVAFSLSTIEFVYICHDRANTASQRVPERLGFELIETSERQKEAPGEEGVLMRWEMSKQRFTTLAQ